MRQNVKKNSALFVVLLAAVCLRTLVAAPASKEPGIVVDPRADRPEAVYKCGETATFAINVTRDGKPLAEGDLTVTLTLDGGRKIEAKTIALGAGPAVISGTLKEPGFLSCAAILRAEGKAHYGYAGAAFEPERIQPAAVMPDDFDAFWAAGRARVDKVPIDVQLTPLPKYTNDRQESFKISMANIDNTRIYGYLSVPKGKKPPFPAYVTVSSAGLGKPRGPVTGYAARGVLTLAMGVHPHDLGLPGEEYVKLGKGELKGYTYKGAPDAEKYYFRRAILGIDRAVRYLLSRPDWDRKHLVYYGSSQGGGFGLILAGLNPQMTAAAMNVPALCDHGGYRANRSPGWPKLVLRAPADRREAYAKMAEYFDAVNFARKIRCPVIVSVGFIDRTCAPSSVYSAYNVIDAPKRIFNGPKTGHGTPRAFGKYLYPWLAGHLGLAKPTPPAAR